MTSTDVLLNVISGISASFIILGFTLLIFSIKGV